MRRWLLIVVLFASRPAFAGGVAGPPSADDVRADRIAAGWKRQGPAAIPDMVKVVCRDGAKQDSLLLRANEQLGELGSLALADLIAAAPDRRCRVTHLIASAVCDGGRDGDARVAAMLRDRRPEVLTAGLKVVSAMAARDCDEHVAAAVPALAPALRTASGEPLRAALAVTEKLGPRAGLTVADLVTLLGKGDDVVTNMAANALGALGPRAAPAVPALRALLPRTAGNVRQNAILALGGIGEPARPALADFLPIVAQAAPTVCADKPRWSEGSAIAFSILKAAAKIGGPGVEPLVPHLVAALQGMRGCDLADGYLDVWLGAFGAFGQYGRAAVPLLLAIVRDDDERWQLRQTALENLEHIERPVVRGGDVAAIKQALRRKHEVFERPDTSAEQQLKAPDDLPRANEPRPTPGAFASLPSGGGAAGWRAARRRRRCAHPPATATFLRACAGACAGRRPPTTEKRWRNVARLRAAAAMVLPPHTR